MKTALNSLTKLASLAQIKLGLLGLLSLGRLRFTYLLAELALLGWTQPLLSSLKYLLFVSCLVLIGLHGSREDFSIFSNDSIFSKRIWAKNYFWHDSIFSKRIPAKNKLLARFF